MVNQNLPAVIRQAVTKQKINPNDVNLMLPTQSFGEVLGQYDKVTIEVVNVDPDPKAGDVYEISGKKVLGKRPLQAIANALGIIWDAEKTTILESTSTKSRAKATGAMRKPNGEWIILSEEKTVDLEAIEEEQRLKYEEDAEKGPIVEWKTSSSGKRYPVRGTWKNEAEKQAWIEREVRKAMLSYRKFKDERAMTGAKERVIKAFIAIKNSYTDEELSKPFAFPRVTLDTSKMLNSPEMRQAAIEKMTGSISAIFGPSNGHSEQSDNIRNVTPENEISTEARKELPIQISDEESVNDFQDTPEEETPFEDDIPWDEPEEEILKRELEEYLSDKRLPSKAINLIREILNEEKADLNDMKALTDRIHKYLAKKEKTKGGVV